MKLTLKLLQDSDTPNEKSSAELDIEFVNQAIRIKLTDDKRWVTVSRSELAEAVDALNKIAPWN